MSFGQGTLVEHPKFLPRTIGPLSSSILPQQLPLPCIRAQLFEPKYDHDRGSCRCHCRFGGEGGGLIKVMNHGSIMMGYNIEFF
mgnify:CR=1 FL=1